jgi:hypothetical protein
MNFPVFRKSGKISWLGKKRFASWLILWGMELERRTVGKDSRFASKRLNSGRRYWGKRRRLRGQEEIADNYEIASFWSDSFNVSGSLVPPPSLSCRISPTLRGSSRPRQTAEGAQCVLRQTKYCLPPTDNHPHETNNFMFTRRRRPKILILK